jgi:transcriptional regulator with XRE-family HTH domain
MALGEKIRELRDELGMSQAQLATQGGLSQGYLSQLENDEVQNPSAAVIFGLAKALHVDPRVLMNAAGYGAPGADAITTDGYDVQVDPDLLKFLARIPREQQSYLLKVLEGMESGGGGARVPPVESAGPRRLAASHRRTALASGAAIRKVAAK